MLSGTQAPSIAGNELATGNRNISTVTELQAKALEEVYLAECPEACFGDVNYKFDIIKNAFYLLLGKKTLQMAHVMVK